jgi:hypothetical protein
MPHHRIASIRANGNAVALRNLYGRVFLPFRRAIGLASTFVSRTRRNKLSSESKTSATLRGVNFSRSSSEQNPGPMAASKAYAPAPTFSELQYIGHKATRCTESSGAAAAIGNREPTE